MLIAATSTPLWDGKKTHSPGEPFECENKEAERLISMGVAYAVKVITKEVVLPVEVKSPKVVDTPSPNRASTEIPKEDDLEDPPKPPVEEDEGDGEDPGEDNPPDEAGDEDKGDGDGGDGDGDDEDGENKPDGADTKKSKRVSLR